MPHVTEAVSVQSARDKYKNKRPASCQPDHQTAASEGISVTVQAGEGTQKIRKFMQILLTFKNTTHSSQQGARFPVTSFITSLLFYMQMLKWTFGE